MALRLSIHCNMPIGAHSCVPTVSPLHSPCHITPFNSSSPTRPLPARSLRPLAESQSMSDPTPTPTPAHNLNPNLALTLRASHSLALDPSPILTPMSAPHCQWNLCPIRPPPPTTRTRVCWQPCGALPQNVPLRSPQVSYLNTPASSTASSPASTVSLCKIDRPIRLPLPPSQVPRGNRLCDAQKNQYVLGLVGQFSFSFQHSNASQSPFKTCSLTCGVLIISQIKQENHYVKYGQPKIPPPSF
jgi:hypothetical protein